jgi:hypothetical protein
MLAGCILRVQRSVVSVVSTLLHLQLRVDACAGAAAAQYTSATSQLSRLVTPGAISLHVTPTSTLHMCDTHTHSYKHPCQQPGASERDQHAVNTVATPALLCTNCHRATTAMT